MNTVKLAYFGSPSFSARVLKHILEDAKDQIEVVCVITQPDKPIGRKQILTPTPVKTLALQYHIPIFETDISEISGTQNLLQKLDSCNLVLVYAYGKKIPIDMLKIPIWGFWNIHPSLLPKYRGVSPITYPLLLGEKTTGVSLMQMDEKFDHGPILDQEEYLIQSHDTREKLELYLSDIGYRLFKKNIQLLIDGKLKKQEQDHSKATYTRLLTKQDGFFPFPVLQKLVQNKPLTQNEIPPIISDYYSRNNLPQTFNVQLSTFDLFRSLSPWPGIWTLLRPDIIRTTEGQAFHKQEKRLKIIEMKIVKDKPIITKVQLEGKKEVERETFEKAYSISLH